VSQSEVDILGMKAIFSNKLPEFVGQKVGLKGWVANIRSSGKIYFIELRDGAGFTQVVVSEKEVDAASWQAAQSLTLESTVIIQGTVSKHPQKEEFELQAKKIELVQKAEEYPIGKKEHGPDFLLDNRHLWLRSSKQWAIQRVRNTIINSNRFANFNTDVL